MTIKYVITEVKSCSAVCPRQLIDDAVYSVLEDSYPIYPLKVQINVSLLFNTPSTIPSS